ncbi:hypothetical protein [Actinomadura roseirufa]|uniref:hypothetical protein n=1 Tax=Actinomadura roseirufa TaxID=2094049 RepID=UPI001A954E66|nr:hypothetical protein [Actinomadura roseirufa]
MSTSDRILLFLHIGFAIFTLGPLTAATMATPRYIRKRNVAVVRYLHRTTQLYGLASLGIFLFGLSLAKGDLARVWLSVSMTLFVVALVLLLIVERDQRKAAHLIELAAAEAVPATPSGGVTGGRAGGVTGGGTGGDAAGGEEPDGVGKPAGGTERPGPTADAPESGTPAGPADASGGAGAGTTAGGGLGGGVRGEVAPVQRGRIAALSGVVALIWVVILILMVWNG